MSNGRRGQLSLNDRTYIVVPTEELQNSTIEHFSRALGIPKTEDLWVGYLIRQHRIKLGLTQAEFGARITLGQKHVDKIENGTIKRPRDHLLLKMIGILGSDFAEGLKIIGIRL